jgi:hypothetical protein
MVPEISDNTRHDPLDADPGQVKDNGEIIWFGRELERSSGRLKSAVSVGKRLRLKGGVR